MFRAIFKKKSVVAAASAVIIAAAGLAGCSSSSTPLPTVPTTTALDTYAEDVRSLTPYVAVEGDLSDWDSGWNPDMQYTMLQKLFGETGVESLYSPVASLDGYIDIINDLSDHWSQEGEIDQGDEASETMTITVDNAVTEVQVPFFANTVPVDHLITITESASGEEWSCRVAFSTATADGGQAIVVHYSRGPDAAPSEVGTYYATRNDTTGDVTIQHASSSTMNINFKWTGNLNDNWFAITQITDGCMGNQQIVGGGSIAGDMAFIAKNNDTGDSAESWYVTATIDNINDGTTNPVTPLDAAATPPDGTGVLQYITDGNDAFPGWLAPADRPTGVSDIAWAN